VARALGSAAGEGSERTAGSTGKAQATTQAF
jgi:hypothetical protein